MADEIIPNWVVFQIPYYIYNKVCRVLVTQLDEGDNKDN